MNRVVHFEVPADNAQRAAAFYKTVFGWTIEKWEGPEEYWLVTTGSDKTPGINGGILKRSDPASNVCNTVQVGSVDDFAAAVEQAGGKVVAPKMPIPGVGYLAYCEDTEGNRFGIMQPDADAK